MVIAAAPVDVKESFGADVRALRVSFDPSRSPEWSEHRSKLARVTDLTLLGAYSDPVRAPGPGPHLAVRSTWLAPTLGAVQLDDFRLGAPLETR